MDMNTNQPQQNTTPPEPDTNYKPQPQPSEAQSAPQSQPQAVPSQSSGGKTSVLAILALVFGIIIPIVGIILGIIALVKIKKDPNLKGKGLAIAGIVIGAVWIFLWFILILPMAYFGVLSPSSVMPTRCIAEPGFYCEDYMVEGNTLTISFINSRGKALEGVSLSGETACTPAGVSWANGATLEFTCPISPATDGKKQSYDLELKYMDSGSSIEKTSKASAYI